MSVTPPHPTPQTGLGLTDGDAGEALRERSARVYDKYGTLMLNTEGLTLSGAQRKATCMALFRKVGRVGGRWVGVGVGVALITSSSCFSLSQYGRGAGGVLGRS